MKVLGITQGSLRVILVKSKLQVLWNNINSRSNPDSAECKRYPKYIGTELWFKSFEEFSWWCHESEGFGLLDSSGNSYHLDKDLAILAGDIDHKAYGNHCVFLPTKLNSVVRLVHGDKKQLPGTTPYKGGRYRMQYTDIEGTKHHGGLFETEGDAHNAWQEVQSQVFNDASSLSLHLGLIKAARMFKQAANRFKELKID